MSSSTTKEMLSHSLELLMEEALDSQQRSSQFSYQPKANKMFSGICTDGPLRGQLLANKSPVYLATVVPKLVVTKKARETVSVKHFKYYYHEAAGENFWAIESKTEIISRLLAREIQKAIRSLRVKERREVFRTNYYSLPQTQLER